MAIHDIEYREAKPLAPLAAFVESFWLLVILVTKWFAKKEVGCGVVPYFATSVITCTVITTDH